MRLAASKGYLGVGAQRKGQDLSNIIVGWFTYQGPATRPILTFNGCWPPVATIAAPESQRETLPIFTL